MFTQNIALSCIVIVHVVVSRTLSTDTTTAVNITSASSVTSLTSPVTNKPVTTLKSDPCAGKTCNHGTCSASTPHGYTCTCEADYTGTDCNTKITTTTPASTTPSVCKSMVCGANKKCGVDPDNAKNPICTCADGFSGTDCKTKTKPNSTPPSTVCDSSPCGEHGNCAVDSSDPTKHNCTCVDGYTGADCKTRTICADKPCKNDASCTVTNSGNNYTCACTSGYEGWNCTGGPCATFLCNNKGTCQSDSKDNTTTVCSCPSGFTGDHCENGAQGMNTSPIILIVLMLPLFSKVLFT